MFMTEKQTAEKWGISDRRVRVLCAEGTVSGATREGRRWMIPADARKPEDGRLKATESLLTEGKLERLTEEFMIAFKEKAIMSAIDQFSVHSMEENRLTSYRFVYAFCNERVDGKG